jgi:hypothetical protein
MLRMRKWDMNQGLLSLNTLQALHDNGSFHVLRREYPPGAKFPGRTRASTWYILQGNCVLNIGGRSPLNNGDVAEVPARNYDLSVGDDGVVIVQVWDLRPHMN